MVDGLLFQPMRRYKGLKAKREKEMPLPYPGRSCIRMLGRNFGVSHATGATSQQNMKEAGLQPKPLGSAISFGIAKS
jgi:hypothetical protein